MGKKGSRKGQRGGAQAVKQANYSKRSNEASEIKGKGRKGSQYPVPGLSNLGNTCFFNSVMQCLSRTHLLRRQLDQIVRGEEWRVELTPPRDHLSPLSLIVSSPAQPFTATLHQFLVTMATTNEGGTLNPKQVFEHIINKAPRFRSYQQQDSQELLRYLLDALRNEEVHRMKRAILEVYKVKGPIKKTATESLTEKDRKAIKEYGMAAAMADTFVEGVFGGQLASSVTCSQCNTCSLTSEGFLDLSLSMPDNKPVGRSAVAMVTDDQPGWRKKKKDSPPKLSKHQLKLARRDQKKAAKRINKHGNKMTDTQQQVDEEGDNDQQPIADEDDDLRTDRTESISHKHLTADQHNDRITDPGITDPGITDPGIPDPVLVDAMSALSLSSHSNEQDSSLEPAHSQKPLPHSDDIRSVDSQAFDFQPKDLQHGDSQPADPQPGGPQPADPQSEDSQPTDPQPEDSKPTDPQPEDSQPADSQPVDPQPEDSQPADPQPEDSQPVDPQPEDSKPTDPQPEDSKPTDPQPEDSKPTDPQPEDSQPTDPQPEDSQSTDPQPEDSQPESDELPSKEDPSPPDPFSIEACLQNFCSTELLTGDDRFACQECTRIQQERDKLDGQQQDEEQDEEQEKEDLQQQGDGQEQVHERQQSETCEEEKRELSRDEQQQESVHQCQQDDTRQDLQQHNSQSEQGEVNKGSGSDPTSHSPAHSSENQSIIFCDADTSKESDDMSSVSSQQVKMVLCDAAHQLQISRTPAVLCLHIKRFSQQGRSMRSLRKNNSHVAFPLLLDMTPYCTPAHQVQCAGQLMYSLYGVVEHSGNMHGGHYTAFICHHRDADAGEDQWYHISDSHVRTASVKELLRAQAYILFYQRINFV